MKKIFGLILILMQLYTSCFAQDYREPTHNILGTLTTKGFHVNTVVANVVNHGATGDGVTDDRADIITAINAAKTAGGGVVYFPIGAYYISAAIVLDGTYDNITFIGENRQSSVIYANGDYAGIQLQASSGDHLNGMEFYDLGFQGSNNIAHTSNRLINVVQYADNLVIDKCYFLEASEDAITIGGFVTDSKITGNIVDTTLHDDGINIGGSGNEVTRVLVSGNTVYNAATDGIHISSGSNHITITNNNIYNSLSGIGIFNSQDNIISGNQIYNCGDGIATKNDTASALMITNNLIDTTTNIGTGHGIWLAHSSSDCIVTNNLLKDIESASTAILVTSGTDQLVANNIINGALTGIDINVTRAFVTGNTFQNVTTEINSNGTETIFFNNINGTKIGGGNSPTWLSNVGHLGIGEENPAFPLDVFSQVTATSGNEKASQFIYEANPTGTSTTFGFGIIGAARTKTGNTQDLGDQGLVGQIFAAQHFGTGTVAGAYASRTYVYAPTSGGVMTFAHGYDTYPWILDGDIGTWYGFRARSRVGSGTGGAINAFGVYVEDQCWATVLKYAFYYKDGEYSVNCEGDVQGVDITASGTFSGDGSGLTDILAEAVRIPNTGTPSSTLDIINGQAGGDTFLEIVSVPFTTKTLTIVDDATLNGKEVKGPTSVTDERVALFDGITGKLIKESVVTDAEIIAVTDGGNADGEHTHELEETKYIAYASTNSLDVDSGAVRTSTFVVIDTELHDPDGWSVTNGEVAIGEAAKFRIIAHVAPAATALPAVRDYPKWHLEGDTGSGSFSVLPGSYGSSYIRTPSQPGTSASIEGVLTTTNTSGKVKIILDGIVTAGNEIYAIANYCSIEIIKIGQ